MRTQDNPYLEFTTASCRVSDYMVEVSDGVKLHIIDFNPNSPRPIPTMLFVAGWISLIEGWKGFLQEITPRMRTLYLETREKISSILPQKKRVEFTMERLRQDLCEVISQIISQNHPFVMAGSSLGASAIIEYLIEPNGVLPECAILIGPNAEFRFPPIAKPIVITIHPSMYSLIKPVIKWYLRTFRIDVKNAPDQMRKYERTLDSADPYKLKANALALMKYSAWDRLNKINTPCLIIGAKTDTLHSAETLQRITKQIPHAEYLEMESNAATHGNIAGKIVYEYIAQKKWKK